MKKHGSMRRTRFDTGFDIITTILLVLALQAVNSATGYVYLELFWWIGFAALCVCTALTLISGGVYLWKNRSLIKNVK